MRKLLLTVVASCALVAIMPASALAHGHNRHHHHARVHHKTFGHDFNQSGSTSSGSTSSGSTGTPSTAGTVQSFDPSTGALTILLNDKKTTVTGIVNSDTEIECQAPDTSGSSSSWQGHDHGGDNGGGDQGDDDQGQGDDDNNSANAQNCDTSALTTGAVVQEASLRISSAGATWDKIELVSSSTSTSSSSSSNGD